MKADQLNDDNISYSEAETWEISSIEVQNLEEENGIYKSEEIPEIPIYKMNNINFFNS